MSTPMSTPMSTQSNTCGWTKEAEKYTVSLADTFAKHAYLYTRTAEMYSSIGMWMSVVYSVFEHVVICWCNRGHHSQHWWDTHTSSTCDYVCIYVCRRASTNIRIPKNGSGAFNICVQILSDVATDTSTDVVRSEQAYKLPGLYFKRVIRV